MELETINKLYLELSQIATAKTRRELELETLLAQAENASDQSKQIARLISENKEFLTLTMLLDEHPEDYQGPCFCKLCQSYSGD